MECTNHLFILFHEDVELFPQNRSFHKYWLSNFLICLHSSSILLLLKAAFEWPLTYTGFSWLFSSSKCFIQLCFTLLTGGPESKQWKYYLYIQIYIKHIVFCTKQYLGYSCKLKSTYLYNLIRLARKLTRGWPQTPQWPGTSGSRRPGRAETWRRPGRWYRPAWSGWCRSAPVNKLKVSYGNVGAKIRIRHSVSTEITLSQVWYPVTNTGTELSMIDNELLILHILFWIVHTFSGAQFWLPTLTELPMWASASRALWTRVGCKLTAKARVMWAQNSTEIPIAWNRQSGIRIRQSGIRIRQTEWD